jgi:hypothetical protein
VLRAFHAHGWESKKCKIPSIRKMLPRENNIRIGQRLSKIRELCSLKDVFLTLKKFGLARMSLSFQFVNDYYEQVLFL